jgi:hypothetical protein
MGLALKQYKEGKTMEGSIHLIPYLIKDGVGTFSDEELAALYNRVLRESLDDVLFYDGEINSAEEFVAYMKNPQVLFVCPFCFHGGTYEPVGFLWANHIDQASMQGHFVFFKDYWGTEWPQKAAQLFCKELTTHMNRTLIGVIPTLNKLANRFACIVGMHKVGMIPKFVYNKKLDKAVDANIYYITKEDFKNENLD